MRLLRCPQPPPQTDVENWSWLVEIAGGNLALGIWIVIANRTEILAACSGASAGIKTEMLA